MDRVTRHISLDSRPHLNRFLENDLTLINNLYFRLHAKVCFHIILHNSFEYDAREISGILQLCWAMHSKEGNLNLVIPLCLLNRMGNTSFKAGNVTEKKPVVPCIYKLLYLLVIN